MRRKCSAVGAAGEALERISQISQDSAAQVGQITHATQLQLQLTRDVVLAVERISEVAKSNRTHAEEARWTTSTLTKLSRKFHACLSPLRRCDDQDFADSDPDELSDADTARPPPGMPRRRCQVGSATGSRSVRLGDASWIRIRGTHLAQGPLEFIRDELLIGPR